LPEPLPKSAGEGIRRTVPCVHRDVGHAVAVIARQFVRSARHAGELDIARHRQSEGRGELTVEMELRKSGNPAHGLEV